MSAVRAQLHPFHRRTVLAGLAASAGLAVKPVFATPPLVVFAAASLHTALKEIGDSYAASTGQVVTIVPAGSSTLARQIQHGAPADIFVSANVDWMDVLQHHGRVLRETRFDLASNALVLVALRGARQPLQISAETDAASLLEPDDRLAMALVDAVPAGLYGKAALTHYGLWEKLAGQVAQSDNVRAALALVATGAAPLGIVYATDADAEPRVEIVARFPAASHPAIRYPAAATAGGDTAAARAFLTHLRGAEAQSTLRTHGFLPVPAA